MAWVSKDEVRRARRGRTVTHTYFRIKERRPDRTIRTLATFRRKPEAYAFLDRYERVGADALDTRPAAKGTLTVSELCRSYLVDKFPGYDPDAEGPVAGSHLGQSIRVLARFENAVGATRPAALLSEDDAKLFHRALMKDDLAAASVHSMLGYLSVFLRWAHRKKLVRELIPVERRDPKVRRPALTWDEAVSILKAAAEWPEKPMKGVERGRLVPILATLLYTGVRRGELCVLQVRDLEGLDTDRPLLHVRYKPAVLTYRERYELVDGKRRRRVEAVTAPWMPKGKTNRAIPVLPPLARVLRGVIPAGARPDAFVFAQPDGRPWSPWGLTSLLRRFANAKLDRSLGTHVWRHTTATLLASRVSSFAVQAVLGHASLATTQKYVSASANLAQMPAGVLPDAFAPPTLAAEGAPTLPAPPECDDEVLGVAERPPRYDRKTARRLVRRRARHEATDQLTLWTTT